MAKFTLHVCDRCGVEEKEEQKDRTFDEAPNMLKKGFELVRLGGTPSRPGLASAFHHERYLCKCCTDTVIDVMLEKLTQPKLENPITAKLKSTTVKLNRARQAFEGILLAINLPDGNCSCHIAAPCADCVENGGLRAYIADLNEALKE